MRDLEGRIVVFTTRDLIRTVADRWREQYQDYTPSRLAGVQKALDALDKETASAAEVEAIIGNASWTRENCGVCERELEKWVRLGDEPDYERQTINVCGDCLDAAQDALRGRD